MRPIVVIGSGGHAKVVIDTLRATGRIVRACTDSDLARHGSEILGVLVEGGDEILDGLDPNHVELAMGIGIPDAERAAQRFAIASGLVRRGFVFPTVVHPSAVLAESVTLGAGAQVMAGAVIQSATDVGDFAVINTRASVDHDSRIGRGAHVAPGATLGGTVGVGEAAMIGLGASVLPGIQIGNRATVGAGSVVTQPVLDDMCVKGVPARS